MRRLRSISTFVKQRLTRSLCAPLLPPLIAAFFCCIFIVIRPVADLSHRYAFLVLTLQYLYFYPAGTLSGLIESSALCFLGAVTSIGYSLLILYFAVLCNRSLPNPSVAGSDDSMNASGNETLTEETVGARAVCAVGLMVLTFACGWVRSSSPRLVNPSRIVLFHSVWLLIDASNIREITGNNFLALFWPTLWSALLSIIALIVGHLILPPERKRLNDTLGEALNGLAYGIRNLNSAKLEVVRPPTPSPEIDDVDGPDGEGAERNERAVGESTSDTAVSSESTARERSLTEKQGHSGSRHKYTYRPLATLLPILREQYSTALHGITYDPMSTRKLRPILTIIYTQIGRNAVVRQLGKGQITELSQLEAGNGTAALMDSLSMLKSSIAEALEAALHGVREAYDWEVSDDPGATKIGGIRGGLMHIKRTGKKTRDGQYVDPRRTLSGLQERLLAGMVIYEQEVLEWLEGGVLACPVNPGMGSRSTTISSRHMAKMLFKRDKTLQLARNDGNVFRPRLSDPHPQAYDAADRMIMRHEERVKLASWLVAMVDLAKDVNSLCTSVRELLDFAKHPELGDDLRYRAKMKRFYFPLFDIAWLERGPTQNAMRTDKWNEEMQEVPSDEAEDREEREALREAREKQDRPAASNGTVPFPAAPASDDTTEKRKATPSIRRASLLQRYRSWWHTKWNAEKSIKYRVKLSRALSNFKHSRHLQYAFKLTLGVMLLAVPGLMPLGSPGRDFYEESRGQWGVISYLYVLDVTTGATLRIGVWRTIGTVGGAIVGYVGYIMARGTAYGLTAVASVTSIPIAWIMLFSSYPGVGIVAGITLPPILFIPYLDRESYHTTAIIALWRAEQVLVGIIGAILVNLFIFPYHARTRYHKLVAQTLDTLGDLYLAMSRENLRPSLVYRLKFDQYAGMERSIEVTLGQCRSLAIIQQLEVSLLPKPHKLHLKLNDHLAKTFELLIDIRSLRQGIPRQETVLDVFALRQNLVSAVYITLYAVSHASRSRTPLPQFLPSPLDALNQLAAAAEDHLYRNRSPSGSPTRPSTPTEETRGRKDSRTSAKSSASELGTLYAFAEMDALRQLCHTVEDMLTTARSLFGIQSFLSYPRLPTCDEEEIIYH